MRELKAGGIVYASETVFAMRRTGRRAFAALCPAAGVFAGEPAKGSRAAGFCFSNFFANAKKSKGVYYTYTA